MSFELLSSFSVGDKQQKGGGQRYAAVAKERLDLCGMKAIIMRDCEV